MWRVNDLLGIEFAQQVRWPGDRQTGPDGKISTVRGCQTVIAHSIPTISLSWWGQHETNNSCWDVWQWKYDCIMWAAF